MDRPRLERLLGDPDARWLVERVRDRMEKGRPLTGTVTLTRAEQGQRAAAERLLGRPPRRGRALTVSLEAVDAVLRRSGASPEGLAQAVEALTGPVRLRSEAEAALRDAWDSAFAPLEHVCGHTPALADWCTELRGTGLAGRLLGGPEDAAPVLARLADVIAALPAKGEGLGTFAARVCGDAHALDDGRPLATLALKAARAMVGSSSGGGTEERRETWAAVGLLKDDLSSTVLTVGLPGDARTPTGRALAALKAGGQPMVLTLRQVVTDPPVGLLAGSVVRVCENPAVIAAAADLLGADCPPLVCLQGQPSAAASALLRGLSDAGAELHYHGDFDWGGIRIANHLHRRFGWSPWRFRTADYLEALRQVEQSRPLSGAYVEADWDEDLAAALEHHGRRIEEESVLDALIGDLALAMPR
ncbi:TIGR02679 family protein [Nocardiopsis suaedae]|uniref:TIGR02679 family protein n=1 Tax=Nocardiopsis suaedae TaxID=3018444 RepID=A0ABT4TPN5_9ACTN|nr:TIGR02679 family protein [Nocardiopsis suaedae]MDA2806639.1 TIGR02679 family protein [Nocardiopsis suaedae]